MFSWGFCGVKVQLNVTVRVVKSTQTLHNDKSKAIVLTDRLTDQLGRSESHPYEYYLTKSTQKFKFISGASQQKSVAAITWTTEVVGKSKKKILHAWTFN